jgi:hypothetical protein
MLIHIDQINICLALLLVDTDHQVAGRCVCVCVLAATYGHFVPFAISFKRLEDTLLPEISLVIHIPKEISFRKP